MKIHLKVGEIQWRMCKSSGKSLMFFRTPSLRSQKTRVHNHKFTGKSLENYCTPLKNHWKIIAKSLQIANHEKITESQKSLQKSMTSQRDHKNHI